MSHGRAGWNIVTNHNPRIAANFGLDEIPETTQRYARAYEFADVVQSLWRTWSPDAIVADKETGVFIRPIVSLAESGRPLRELLRDHLGLPRPHW